MNMTTTTATAAEQNIDSVEIVRWNTQFFVSEFGHIGIMSMAGDPSWFFEETPKYVPPEPNRNEHSSVV